MTPDELRARCEQFCMVNTLYYFDAITGGKAIHTPGMKALESLCREMITEGLEMAAGIADGAGFLTDNSPEARFGRSCARVIQRESQRVKNGGA